MLELLRKAVAEGRGPSLAGGPDRMAGALADLVCASPWIERCIECGGPECSASLPHGGEQLPWTLRS